MYIILSTISKIVGLSFVVMTIWLFWDLKHYDGWENKAKNATQKTQHALERFFNTFN